MQQDFPAASQYSQETSTQSLPALPNQHGFWQHRPGSSAPNQQPRYSDNLSPQSRSVPCSAIDASADGVNADQLDERLRGLNFDRNSQTPGQRISDYENALTPATPRQALGFKVIKRANHVTDGPQLADFPNEILTHILSHLHPDSHSAIALVSRRFYTLVTTPHAWRMAFQRYFPGQDSLVLPRKVDGFFDLEDSNTIRSEVRQFTRLTAHASWRSEYLLRTRLLRSLARGKPGSRSGGIGSSSRASQSGKKISAVLTYNAKLPSIVTHIHATFNSSAKKAPRVVHGGADLGMCSASDPTNGKVEKWGLDDPFVFSQLEEVVPHLLPYGIGEGPAALPNVMDVSQHFGVVSGEGFPGGRVFYRPSGVFRGRYLGQDVGIVEAYADIPKIPELSEGVASVWMAKSPVVPAQTQSMVGILTGSTLGVVTAYALGQEATGARYTNCEMSARWVLSPGVPIISIKVDEQYSQRRKAAGRVWAVALNALGEVYYLTQPPIPLTVKSKADDSAKHAWYAGRSTYWHLVEPTRRRARPDETGKNAVRGAYSPRSPADAMNLNKNQMVAEAREIEKFLRYKPSHFRKVCDGWDMRRKLEVDFASDDESGAGEGIFIIDCALGEDQVASITRFTRTSSSVEESGDNPVAKPEPLQEITPSPSLFGGDSLDNPPSTASQPSALPSSSDHSAKREISRQSGSIDEWRATSFSLTNPHVQVIASSIDTSSYALVASFEDPLTSRAGGSSSAPATPTRQSPNDVPGRRARLLGIGTNQGTVVLWNMRAGHLTDGVEPLRAIQTESPEVTCLAISALYVVHGGSDGLVQAWDPLGSTLDSIRTVSARSSGRIPRHLAAIHPALRNVNMSAVGAVYLDPDPTTLRGVVAFGTFVRYWSYSSTGLPAGRKRRLRHSDAHGRPDGRRHIGGVKGYIAAEAEELRLEQEHNMREQARLRARFGVGLADLTEEEAIRYAELISQESFLAEEQRRTSASDTGSAADFDTTSTSARSTDTVTPEPSIAGISPPTAGSNTSVREADGDSDYERQIQQALRLSLLEGVNDNGQFSHATSSGDYEFPVTYKEKRGKRTPSTTSPPSRYISMEQCDAGPSSATAIMNHDDLDDDLRLALELSLAEEELRSSPRQESFTSHHDVGGDFPALSGGPLAGSPKGKAKGKGKTIWRV
ncbi:F-box and WD domain protein [Xylariales sp. PMI_506]|nr:F-box and WD domain protein [Xylariales sp. PMI_506]